jgi:hypothetical protein
MDSGLTFSTGGTFLFGRRLFIQLPVSASEGWARPGFIGKLAKMGASYGEGNVLNTDETGW